MEVFRMARYIPVALVALNVLAAAVVSVAPWMWG